MSIAPALGLASGKKVRYAVVGLGDIDEKAKQTSIKATDQFGGEMRDFSDCIVNDREPEPDAQEGLADLRVIEGVLNALETGQAQVLPPFTRTRRIDSDTQKQTRSMTRPPDPVHAGPARD